MRKFIAIFLIAILSLSMLTACGSNLNDPADGSNTEAVTPSENETETTIPEGEPIHPEGEKVPSEDDYENEIVPPEDDGSIHGNVKLFSPKGTYKFSIDNNSSYIINDEFVVSENKLTQIGNDYIVCEANKDEDKEDYTLTIADNFKVDDTLTVEVSETQNYETTIAVNTEQGRLGVSNHFANKFAFRIQDEYVRVENCYTEFAYESILSEEDNRSYGCIQIYGQWDEDYGDLEIYYDGVKYIVSSTQDIYGLRVAVYNEAMGTDGTVSVSEYFGKEFEVIVEENNSVTFIRTKR